MFLAWPGIVAITGMGRLPAGLVQGRAERGHPASRVGLHRALVMPIAAAIWSSGRPA